VHILKESALEKELYTDCSTLKESIKKLMTKIVDANWESVNSASVISGNGDAKTIEQTILEAIEQARQACELKGNSSTECAVAWDIVEELQAEKSHRLTARRKTALEQYCDENPNAVECLIYDV
jgi:hypothetical protein